MVMGLIFDFVTADLHLGHVNVLKHAMRPFSCIEEHDETLISQWNKVVSKKNTIVIIGDLAWKNHRSYLSRLNGKKILIKGNHDKMSQLDYSQFTRVETLWDTKQDNIKICFCHYPMLSWNSSCHLDSWNLHGHSHGRTSELETIFRMDCGVDCSPEFYSPFSWDFIKFKMSQKRYEKITNNDLDPNQKLYDTRNNNEKLLGDFLKSKGSIS
jgi:calcineurin-like phosphoesterase family protein